MAGKGLSGQLDLFDFFRDAGQPAGEVQMVSLMPGESEKEPEPAEQAAVFAGTIGQKEEEKKISSAGSKRQKEEEKGIAFAGAKSDDPVMHREFSDAQGNVMAEISYLDYNKVYYRNPEEQGRLVSFDNSREAVDFYIEQMNLCGRYVTSQTEGKRDLWQTKVKKENN